MIEAIKNNLAMVIFSVVVHIILISLLAISFNSKIEPKTLAAKPDVIKAVAVDANKVKEQLDKLKREEIKKKKQEKDRLEKLKREEKNLRKKRADEENRLADLKKKRKAEEKKRRLEQKNLAELKKEKKALKKKQAEAEKKRKAEKARLAKKKKQQDSLKKKQELAKKKSEAEAKKRRQDLAQQLEAEEREEADEHLLREIDKYTTLIKQKIQRNWIKPQGDLTSFLATFNIRLIPGGDVIEVRITRTSGNLVYDRNAERAIYKASPLPLPKNPALAARFYNFYFDFIE